MDFHPPLVPGRLVRRYKRFLVDVRLDDGRTVVAHSTNTGSLLGCLVPNARVMLRPEDGETRRLKWTWQLVRVGRAWIGVDTRLAVPLVLEALERGMLPELQGYERVRREVRYGSEQRSRIDVLLASGGRPPGGRARADRADWPGERRVYVEVKNTTLALDRDGRRCGAFPDAVTERGRKHLHELVHVVRQGHRAAMVYCVQRGDCDGFVSADEIDPAYGRALREAVEEGVEAYAILARPGPRRVRPERRLTITL